MAAGWMSPPEVSAKLGIPLRTVQSACQHGALKCEKLGRFYLVLPEDAQAFAERWVKRNRSSRNRSNEGS